MSLAAACVSLALLVPPATGTVVRAPEPSLRDVATHAILPASETSPTVADSAVPTRPDQTRLLRTESRRPGILPAMYVSFGALQVLDVYSTRRAISAGGTEANPVMKGVAGNSAAMLAVKSAATAFSIYCTEKAWKRNRKVAVILMAALNGATAAVAAHNLRQAR